MGQDPLVGHAHKKRKRRKAETSLLLPWENTRGFRYSSPNHDVKDLNSLSGRLVSDIAACPYTTSDRLVFYQKIECCLSHSPQIKSLDTSPKNQDSQFSKFSGDQRKGKITKQDVFNFPICILLENKDIKLYTSTHIRKTIPLLKWKHFCLRKIKALFNHCDGIQWSKQSR